MIQKTEPKLSKVDIAAKLLEKAIVTCELKPGSLMAEADLAKMLGLGRTPVREALLRLANENLVQLSRAGVSIPSLDAMKMIMLLELREPIESICIQKAAQRQTAADREQFKAILRRLEPLSANDREGFMVLLTDIHASLAEASKNEFIHSTLRATQGLSRRFWYHFATDEDQTFCSKLYIRLLKALVASDATGALEQSSRLIQYLRKFTTSQIKAMT
jgi:DNA-binding GntR family transcriptional regulator